MANYGILWIALCLALLINKKTRKLGIICSVALVLNYMTCNVIIKSIVGRTRPFEAIEELTLLIQKTVDTSVETIKNSTKSTTKKSTKKTTTTKETTKKNTTTTTKKEEKKEEATTTSTLEVEAPDTSSNGYLYILGIMVLSSGTYYIYRNRELNN